MTTDLIYIILKNHLLTIPEIKRVDFFYGETLESNTGKPLINTPAILLEFDDSQLQNVSSKVQQGTLLFTTHIITANMYDNDKRITEGGTLNHFVLCRAVYQKLSGFSSLLSGHPAYGAIKGSDQDHVLINSITRSGYRSDHKLKKLMRSTMDFSTLITDRTATKELQSIKPNLQINT